MDNKVPQQINDIVGDNVKKLAQLFPSAVKDGEVDFEALREELGEFQEVGSEKYELTWAGKKNAKKIVQEDVFGRTLKFIPEDSRDADTTENLYIEGDNLEVLKLLRQNYYGMIKAITIDPPYNTGEDFIYNDSYAMSVIESDVAEGITDRLGERYTINKDSQNRFHANWLNMMYPRLKIAKDLLTDDGVIFIFIDDNEQETLKILCDDVFGKSNYIGTIILQTATDNNPRQINTEHEYIHCYAKNKAAQEAWSAPSEKAKKIQEKYNELKHKYQDDIDIIQSELRAWIKKNRDELRGVTHYDNVDDKGVFHDGDIANTVFGGYIYDVIHPVTGKVCKIPEKGFRFSESTMKQMLADDQIMFGVDETTLIKPKKRLENAKDVLRSVIYEDGRASTKQFEELMSRDIFQNPKSPMIIERLLSFVTSADDYVLDFFSGSSTTADAVFRSNVQRGTHLKFIMVQLPENLDESKERVTSRAKKTIENAIKFLQTINKPHTICEIGKERIRREGDKIQSENLEADIDIGFKVFRTADTNIKWNSLMDMGQIDLKQLEYTPDQVDFMPDAKDVDIVYELMLRQKDVPLSSKIEQVFGGGYKRTYLYADSYLVCLETKITNELIDKLARIDPLPIKFIFRDSAFQDDIALKDETFRRLKALIEKNNGMQKMAYTVEFL